jgi:ribosomal protein S7
VQGGKSADKFLRDNREALKTLDSTGAGIQNRLSEIVRNFEPIEANQAALGEQVKAIPQLDDESVANQQRIVSKSAKYLSGVSDSENLAKIAVNGDARLMGRILHKLTPEAKPELANQVISNAFEPITAGAENAGAKTAKALENSRIATLLKATYGKEEGAAKLADFKETANIQSMLEKVKKEAPNHPYDTAQALDNLTEGKPALKRTIEKIMSVLNDQEQFEALAMTGRRIGENTKKMATEATPHTPYQLTTEGATLRWIHGLVTKQADKAIAEKLSRELMSSEAFANAIERAQSRLPYDERNLRIGAGGLAGQGLSALQSRTSYSGEQ